MNHRMISLAVACAALVSCVAGGTSEETDSAENAAALDQPSPVPEETALDGLPRWRTYLRGKDALTFPFPPTPGPLDHLGGVVAIREGDEERPERWISFRLVEHWNKGDRYFEDLMKAGTVTGTDLLMITSDLLQHGEHLPPLPRVGRSREGGGDWSPFPGFPGSPGSAGDDHTGGPVIPRPRPTPGGARPRPGNPRPGGLRPGPGRRPRPPRRPTVPAGEHVGVGVERADPLPVPSPFDAGYQPRRGEKREVFKCEGGVYNGYRRACIDFQAMPSGVKWGVKLSGWTGRYFDPKNIAMTSREHENLCKVALTVVAFTGCLAAIVGCGTAVSMTLGGVTIPCSWVTGIICTGHGLAPNLFDCTRAAQ